MGRLNRKGAPDTFDVAGLGHMLVRLKENSEVRVAVPVFDREIEIARAGARFIDQSTNRIIVEGNYILVDREPWSNLRSFFDWTVFIDVPEDDLRRRIRGRWEFFGFSEAEVLDKMESNDLPNGRFVRENSAKPDMIVRQGSD